MSMPVVRGRVLGIDFGKRRVGLAVSDPLGILASGRGSIDNTPALVERIAELVKTEEIVGVVVGMPYAPDGGLGAQGVEIQAFVEELRAHLSIPVSTWDESQTSRNASALLREGGARRRVRRQKGRIDEMAARLLLQEYLDNQASSMHHS